MSPYSHTLHKTQNLITEKTQKLKYMKHKKQRIILTKLWTFCLGSLCLGACSSFSIEGEEAWTDAEKVPIAFGANLSRAAVNTGSNGTPTGMQDYAVWGWHGYQSDGTLPPSGGEVQVFDQTIVDHATGTYEGTRYWEKNKTYRFYAVHPAGMETVSLPTPDTSQPSNPSQPIGCESGGTIWVRGFDASAFGAKAVDFMTGRSEPITTPESGKPSPGPVALSFQHELAKVNFVILGAKADVTVTEVKLLGVGYQGNFITPYTDHTTTWSNIQYTETDNPATNPYKVGPFEMSPSDKDKNIFGGDLLLIPQQLTETSRFVMSWEYKNGGQKRTVQVPFPQAGPDRWERGKSYVYSATIPAYESEITLDVKVQDWNKPIVVDVELN